MNPCQGARRRPRTDAAHRAELLAAFAPSGSSAAAFARQHGLNYPTFCGWRQRQGNVQPPPDFVQSALPPPAVVELVLELGPGARERITEASQIALAVRLLQELNAPRPG